MIIKDIEPRECIIQITGCMIELYAMSNYGNLYMLDTGNPDNGWKKVENIPFADLNKEKYDE
jgi:hypothetical protein